MEKHELIMTIAKEVSSFRIDVDATDVGHKLKNFDQTFKAIVKTLSEAYETIKTSN